MLGSVTERVMRKASCPVLTVNRPSHEFVAADKQPSPVHLNRILFCTDFSENSRQALDHAISIRTEYDAQLTLLHVLEDTPHPATIQETMAAATQQLDGLIPAEIRQTGKIKTMVLIGKAYQQIVQFALETKTDLVVMAVRGRGTIDLAVFGSTTHRVMQFAPCPVFVVHI
jgi:nucleotide-binding universal stress UspA family protein